MPLSNFNPRIDRWAQRILSFPGSPQLRDHLSRSFVSYLDFALTATQLDTANASPVTIVPAPGAGQVILPLNAYTVIAAGSTAFELGTGTLQFKVTNGSGAEVLTAVPNAQLEATANTTDDYWSVALAFAPVVNSPIVVQPSADVTAGNGTIYGRIWYRTLVLARVGRMDELA